MSWPSICGTRTTHLGLILLCSAIWRWVSSAAGGGGFTPVFLFFEAWVSFVISMTMIERPGMFCVLAR